MRPSDKKVGRELQVKERAVTTVGVVRELLLSQDRDMRLQQR